MQCSSCNDTCSSCNDTCSSCYDTCSSCYDTCSSCNDTCSSCNDTCSSCNDTCSSYNDTCSSSYDTCSSCYDTCSSCNDTCDMPVSFIVVGFCDIIQRYWCENCNDTWLSAWLVLPPSATQSAILHLPTLKGFEHVIAAACNFPPMLSLFKHPTQ